MKNHNAVIKDVAYYHPDNVVDNEYFIKHFDAQGVDIRHLLKSFGRRSRYLSNDPNENVLTMGVKASQILLKKVNIDPKELNLIVFSSITTEYFCPTTAAKIHEFIGAGQKCSVYDLNADCAGMLVALDQVSHCMRDNSHLKYALIIGSEQISKYAKFDDPIPYANLGDCSCAIILENISNTDSGFIDSDSYTNTCMHDAVVLPPNGTSSFINNKDIKTEDKLIQWVPASLKGAFNSAIISINELLCRNNLTTNDIKKYFLSQFSKKSIAKMCDQLGEDIKKFAYIGDEFGYTGTTSPLLAFAKTVEEGELKKGDYVLFWTVGSGFTCKCILYRY